MGVSEVAPSLILEDRRTPLGDLWRPIPGTYLRLQKREPGRALRLPQDRDRDDDRDRDRDRDIIIIIITIVMMLCSFYLITWPEGPSEALPEPHRSHQASRVAAKRVLRASQAASPLPSHPPDMPLPYQFLLRQLLETVRAAKISPHLRSTRIKKLVSAPSRSIFTPRNSSLRL